MTATADAARAKLTARELTALRSELRRELAAEPRPAKRERVRELPELTSCARRMIRACGSKAGADVEGLAELAALRADVDAALAVAVAELRTREGGQAAGVYSWSDIGRVLGITRQSAQERFSRKS